MDRMRQSSKDSTRVAAASKILEVRQGAKASGRLGIEEPVALSVELVHLLLETRKQTQQGSASPDTAEQSPKSEAGGD